VLPLVEHASQANWPTSHIQNNYSYHLPWFLRLNIIFKACHWSTKANEHGGKYVDTIRKVWPSASTSGVCIPSQLAHIHIPNNYSYVLPWLFRLDIICKACQWSIKANEHGGKDVDTIRKKWPSASTSGACIPSQLAHIHIQNNYSYALPRLFRLIIICKTCQ